MHRRPFFSWYDHDDSICSSSMPDYMLITLRLFAYLHKFLNFLLPRRATVASHAEEYYLRCWRWSTWFCEHRYALLIFLFIIIIIILVLMKRNLNVSKGSRPPSYMCFYYSPISIGNFAMQKYTWNKMPVELFLLLLRMNKLILRIWVRPHI